MQPNLLLHPNFFTLKNKLNLSTYAVVGLLQMLWQIAAEHAEDGDLWQFTPEALAATLDWKGPADQLVAALVESKWLDQSSTGGLTVHDWLRQAPARVRNRLRKQAAMSTERGPEHTPEQVMGHAEELSEGQTEPTETTPMSTAPTTRRSTSQDESNVGYNHAADHADEYDEEDAYDPDRHEAGLHESGLYAPEFPAPTRAPLYSSEALKALANKIDPETAASMRSWLAGLHPTRK